MLSAYMDIYLVYCVYSYFQNECERNGILNFYYFARQRLCLLCLRITHRVS